MDGSCQSLQAQGPGHQGSGRGDPAGSPPLPPLEDLAVVAPGDPRRRDQAAPRFNIASPSGDLAAVPAEGGRPADDRPSRTSAITIQYGDKQVSLDLIAARAEQGFHPVFHRTLGGTLKLGFTTEAQSEEDANPRFVIIEHYRLSSFFGDYGAGRTLGAFSLMPGEETTLYIRNWRRSEETVKESSSIFDSYTSEAADELDVGTFQQLLEFGIIFKGKHADWAEVERRFAANAEIVIYACNVGLSASFLQEIADFFLVTVRGFDQRCTTSSRLRPWPAGPSGGNCSRSMGSGISASTM